MGTYNFQINPDNNRKDWNSIQPYRRKLTDRVSAVHLANRLARVFKAEVRLTEGNYPFTTSGSYFRDNN